MGMFRERFTFDVAAAVVVLVLFVGVPVKAYVHYRSLYGEFAELKLFVFGALGMSAVFSLFAGQGRRVLALVPGLVAGFGGVAAQLYLPAPEIARGGPSWVIVFLVGATPGMLFYWLLHSLHRDPDGP